MMKNKIKILSILGVLEGVSYLVLLGICMPLKYLFAIPEATAFAGMAHGLLFIAYCVWVLIAALEYKWSATEILWSLLASILPFGTFVADRKIFKQYA